MDKNIQKEELEVRVFGKHKLNQEESKKAELALEELSNHPVPRIPDELLKLDPSLGINTRDIYVDKFKDFSEDIFYLVDDRAINNKGEFLVSVSTRTYRQKKENNYVLEYIKNI